MELSLKSARPHLLRMYFVYFLKSKKTNDQYIGFTSNLKLRFTQHNNGSSFYTKNKLPWELIYYEAYKNKSDAIRRERMLKYDGRAKSMLKKRIYKSLGEEGAA